MSDLKTPVSTVIRDGRIIDPANDIDFIGDIAISDGTISAVGQQLPLKAVYEFDARGCIVTPGLIDCHVHCYEHATPLGINPDETCLSRGVTTVVDAGSSGASTFPGLRRFIAERSKTRVLCFLHIAKHGLSFTGCSGGVKGGEIDSLNCVDVEECAKCINANRDMIVGVKVRLSETISDGGKNEEEAFRRSLRASTICKVPLMVHHTWSTIPTQSQDHTESLCCPRDLRPGDIYTHTFIGHKSTIIDPTSGTIYADVKDAKRRGVLFEVGHGQGAFNWTVAEICAKDNFFPDIIGSDLHIGNINGPAYDLPTIMSKFLYFGMSLPEVIKAATSTPACALNLSNEIGSLSVGRRADITVLKVKDVDIDLEDCKGQTRRVTTILRPVAVWKDGLQHNITTPKVFPNIESRKRGAPGWNGLIIRDKKAPIDLHLP